MKGGWTNIHNEEWQEEIASITRSASTIESTIEGSKSSSNSRDIQSWQCINLSCNVNQCVLHPFGWCHSDFALCRRALLSNIVVLCHPLLPAPFLVLDSSYSNIDLVSQFTRWILYISWHSYLTSVSVRSVKLVTLYLEPRELCQWFGGPIRTWVTT